jgi:arginine utilization regulatory protein
MNIAEDSSICRKHLPYHLLDAFDRSAKVDESNTIPLKEAIWQLEKQLIQDTLNKAQGNVTKTAELLNIPRQTLQYKIGKYKLAASDAEK